MIRASLLCAALGLSEPASADTGPRTRPGAPTAGLDAADALRAQIASFWQLPQSGILPPRVVLRVTFTPEGRVGDLSLIESDGTNPAGTEAAFQAARRAILRAEAGGLWLPDGVAANGLDLVFDPAAGAVR